MSLRLVLVLVLLATLSGCGQGTSYSLVPVSGVVTLDGKPVPGAIVTFQPRSAGEDSAGPGSTGRCDDSGRYDLKTIRNEAGAVVAPHKVTIFPSTQPSVAAGKSSDEAVQVRVGATIPAKYNYDSVLTFEVPGEGTDSANFELTSDP